MPRSPDIRHELDHAAVGEAWQSRIRFGDDSIGWEGDQALTLVFNSLEDRFEVWFEPIGHEPKCVLRSQPMWQTGRLPSIQELCIHLRDNDLKYRSIDDVTAAVDQHNAAVEKAARDKGFQKQAEALEKVYWHAGRDMGEYRPVIGGFDKK